MDMREKQLSHQYFFEGKIMKARLDEVLLPNGRRARREVCEHVGGVGVLPVDRSGNIILVRQFRYPYDTELLEIPAGKLDHGRRTSPRAARGSCRRRPAARPAASCRLARSTPRPVS